MEANEFQKTLEENPELARNLKEALGRNAGADELSGILACSGVDAATAEAVLAECQLKRGAAIGTQELDDEEFDHVAGGEDCSATTWCDVNASDCKYTTACNRDYQCTFDYVCSLASHVCAHTTS